MLFGTPPTNLQSGFIGPSRGGGECRTPHNLSGSRVMHYVN